MGKARRDGCGHGPPGAANVPIPRRLSAAVLHVVPGEVVAEEIAQNGTQCLGGAQVLAAVTPDVLAALPLARQRRDLVEVDLAIDVSFAQIQVSSPLSHARGSAWLVVRYSASCRCPSVRFFFLHSTTMCRCADRRGGRPRRPLRPCCRRASTSSAGASSANSGGTMARDLAVQCDRRRFLRRLGWPHDPRAEGPWASNQRARISCCWELGESETCLDATRPREHDRWRGSWSQ